MEDTDRIEWDIVFQSAQEQMVADAKFWCDATGEIWALDDELGGFLRIDVRRDDLLKLP